MLSAKPTGDLISRADAIEAVIEYWDGYAKPLDSWDVMNQTRAVLETLPSADAERPKVVGFDYSPYRIQTTAPSAVREMRLIDANAIDYDEYWNRNGDGFTIDVCQKAQRIIDEQPTIPSAEAVHESCEDCPLYDKEKHNCPRFNKVIPRTIADISAEAVQGWIPFKTRPLTDEEKQEYPDWTYIFDCPLPDDGEEILLSNGKYVWTDTFINDGECYLDGGDDMDDGMAWMHLPEPYEPKTERRG